MFTKFTGFTTSGQYATGEKKYCRTELREYWQGNQSTNDNWYFDSYEHEMLSTLSVEYCEGEGLVYVGQIHGKSGTGSDGAQWDASPATIKIFWEDDEIGVEYYTTDGIVDGEWTSSTGVEKPIIGEVGNNEFTIGVKISNGKFYFSLECEATGVDTGYVEYYDYKSNGYAYQNYFKTGNYFRHDDDYTSECEVTLYSVSTNHTTP